MNVKDPKAQPKMVYMRVSLIWFYGVVRKGAVIVKGVFTDAVIGIKKEARYIQIT